MTRETKIIFKGEDQVTPTVDRVAHSSDQLGGSWERTGSIGSSILVPALAAVGTALAAIKLAEHISEWERLSDVQAQAEQGMKQVLISMGRYSAGLEDTIKTTASAIQGVSNFGDEAVLAGAKILATFPQISDEVLPKTLEVTADLAAYMETDFPNAARIMGMAAMGNVGQLSRYGITLSDTAKKSKDFGLIQEEIAAQVGGQAKVMREASSGAEAYGNVIGDIKEKLGDFAKAGLRPLNEGLTSFATVIDTQLGDLKATEGFDDMTEAGNQLRQMVERLADQAEKSGAIETFFNAIGAGAKYAATGMNELVGNLVQDLPALRLKLEEINKLIEQQNKATEGMDTSGDFNLQNDKWGSSYQAYKTRQSGTDLAKQKEEIQQHIDSLEVAEEVTRALEAATRENEAAWEAYLERLAEGKKPVQEISTEMQNLQKTYDAAMKSLERELKMVGMTAAEKELQGLWNKLEDIETKYGALGDEAVDAMQAAEVSTYAAKKAADETAAAVKKLADDLKAGYKDLNEQGIEATKQAIYELGREVENEFLRMGLDVDEFNAKNRTGAEDATLSWDSFAQNMQGTFSDVFRRYLDGEADALEAGADLFKDTIAELQAYALTNEIKVIIKYVGDKTGLTEDELLSYASAGMTVFNYASGLWDEDQGNQGSAIGGTAGSIMGGVGGFILGGPTGAALGAAIGGFIGDLIGGLFDSETEFRLKTHAMMPGNLEDYLSFEPENLFDVIDVGVSPGDVSSGQRAQIEAALNGVAEQVQTFVGSLYDAMPEAIQDAWEAATWESMPSGELSRYTGDDLKTLITKNARDYLGMVNDTMFDALVGATAEGFGTDVGLSDAQIAALSQKWQGMNQEVFDALFAGLTDPDAITAAMDQYGEYLTNLFTGAAAIMNYRNADLLADVDRIMDDDPFLKFTTGLEYLDKQIDFIGESLNELDGLEYASAIQEIGVLLKDRYEMEIEYLVALKQMQEDLLQTAQDVNESYALDTMTPEEKYTYYSEKADSEWALTFTSDSAAEADYHYRQYVDAQQHKWDFGEQVYGPDYQETNLDAYQTDNTTASEYVSGRYEAEEAGVVESHDERGDTVAGYIGGEDTAYSMGDAGDLQNIGDTVESTAVDDFDAGLKKTTTSLGDFEGGLSAAATGIGDLNGELPSFKQNISTASMETAIFVTAFQAATAALQQLASSINTTTYEVNA